VKSYASLQQEIIVSRPDHVALQNSDLNPFLHADLGTESNGSTLTMLSVLARLDQDPWVEAARWAKLPKAVAVDRLVTIIDGIPLSPGTASGTRATVARLVLLLPAPDWHPGVATASLPSQTVARAFGASPGVTALPRWLPMAVLACALVVGIALNLTHTPTAGSASTEMTQTKAQAPAAESR
jgi:hypothetical protein